MARACIPFHVKNTFITVGEEDVLDDDDDITALKVPTKRQNTAPVYSRKGEPTEPDSEPENEAEPTSPSRSEPYVWATESELGDLEVSDWRTQVTGVELGVDRSKPDGVQQSLVLNEQIAFPIEDQMPQESIVSETASWMFGLQSWDPRNPPGNPGIFQNWQMTADTGYGSQHMMTPLAHSDTELASQPPSDNVFVKELALQPPSDWNDTTTVMMRNLPNKYTQGMLLGEINAAGFSKSYDFFYLPIDPDTRANRGYAFINFRDATLSWNFKLHFESHQMSQFNSHKSITVVSAALQGFDANYQHYSKCRASKSAPEMRPLFFRDFDLVVTSRYRRSGKPSLIDLAAKQKVTSNASKEPVRFCYNCGDAAGPEFKFCRTCGTCLQK